MTNAELVDILRQIKSRAERGLWTNYDSERMSLVIAELDEDDPYTIPNYMNPPQSNGNTIDLCNTKEDYRAECDRIASILESVSREKDEYEKELHKVQLSLEMCKGKLRMIKSCILS